MRIAGRTDEQAAAVLDLTNRHVDGHDRLRHHALVIDVRHDADNPPRHRFTEVRIGPPHMPVQRIAFREHTLRDTLADDRNRLDTGAVVIGEFAAGENRNAEHCEETRPDHPQARSGILFAIRRLVAFDGELRPAGEQAGVAPGYGGAYGDVLDARQLADAARGLAK